MTLVAVDGSPGLHVDDAWQEGTAGTFALVVGVSVYPHLNGGSAHDPNTDTFGLGQLHVSALTARRFVDWLEQGFRLDDRPLAKCWLLAAPTSTEIAADPRLADAAAPTMANLDAAIKGWHAALEELPHAAASTSRAILFFSGHGIEVRQQKQILLPSDFLAPPTPNVNDSVSTEYTAEGLRDLAVNEVFFFLDACRNDVDRLRSQDVEGRKILPIRVAAATNPDQLNLHFYAAASGTQTYQPREVADGMSVFGQALLHGLSGSQPGVALSCDDTECSIDTFPLHAHLKTRVREILQSYRSDAAARVRLGGSVDNLAVTVIDAPRSIRGPSSPPSDGTTEIYSAVHEHVEWRPSLDGFHRGHDLVGSEAVTAISQRMTLRSVDTGELVSPEDFVVAGVSHTDSRRYRLDVRVPNRGIGVWLAVPAGNGEWGVFLPTDADLLEHTYRVELDHDGEGGISRMEAALSPLSPIPWGHMATAWETSQASHLGAGVDQLDLDIVEATVEGKLEAPLAAAVGATLLVQARRWKRLHDWLRNLSDWFSFLPDGAVLWAEQLRLTKDPAPGIVAERIEHLGRLHERGYPWLSDVFEIASASLETMAERGLSQGLEGLRTELRALQQLHRPGGMFTIFHGDEAALRQLQTDWLAT